MENSIYIYRVRGIDGTCYASKEAAEVAALNAFPQELAVYRYTRVYYLRLEGNLRSLDALVLNLTEQRDIYASQSAEIFAELATLRAAAQLALETLDEGYVVPPESATHKALTTALKGTTP